jgi:cytochrome c oxidase subunit 4
MSETTHHAAGHSEKHVGHDVPLWILVATLVALLILTWITVGATLVDFGATINLWIALVVATIKATLVALYFMHLRYDKPIVAIILVGTLFFVALFIGVAVMDSRAYQGNIAEYRGNDPARFAPLLDQE